MGIYIKENQECSYLYLCGIKPFREVELGDGITLLPAFSNPEPEDMIDSMEKQSRIRARVGDAYSYFEND